MGLNCHLMLGSMNKIKIFVLAVGCLLATGCGASKAQKKEASPTPERVNANTVKANIPSVPKAMAPATSNSNARPTMRGRRDRVDIDPSATPLPLSFEKAGENSRFAISMDREGVVTETRIFNDHPQIQKVEMKWLDAKIRSVEVLLKNGKIAQAKTDRVTSIRAMSSSDLLALVGIKGSMPASERPRI
jgi:PBP1b-binding outer membrane lipoprotein LpoB